MTDFFLIVCLAASVATATVLVATPLAQRLKLLDFPSELKTHDKPTALIGGLVVYTAILACLLFIERPNKLDHLLTCVTFLVLLGLLDDIFHLPVWPRIVCQIGAILMMMIGAEVWINDFSPIALLPNEPSLVAYALTIFIGVFTINAFNMSDGMDGLAATNALSALALIIAGQYYNTEIRQAPWILGLATGIVIFGIFNLGLIPKYKIFLGDGGSLPIGFLLFWLLVDFSQGGESPSIRPIMALWCMTVPLFDAVSVSCHRLVRGVSPTSGDNQHIHHKLQAMNFSKLETLLILASVNIGLGCVGIALAVLTTEWISLIFYGCSFLVFHFLHNAMPQKRQNHN